MINFDFISPTKIFFGKDRELEVGNIIASYGFKKIALIYGGGSIKKIGLYDKVIASLKENNIEYVEISGVEPNPKLSHVKKAVKTLENENIELILAVGGGSVIDEAKSISHGLVNEGDPFDFNISKRISTKALPVGVILTLSAAGSELSTSCVITNDEVIPFKKNGFNNELNRPLFAICNPILTYSVNKFQTGCGIVDILMHTLERYMNSTDSCMFSEQVAIGLMKTVLHYGKIAIENPNDYEARANLMLASSYSHNGLTGLGKKQFMRVHGLEHTLSGCYDEVAHGAGLSVLWPAWCLFVLKDERAHKQLKTLAKELFNLDDAKEGILALKQYFKDIGMPTTLKELNTNKPIDIEYLALTYSNNKTRIVKDFIDIDYQAAKEIFALGE